MDPINGLGKTQEEAHVTQVKDANPGILDTILILVTIQIIANVLGIRRHQVTVLDIAIGKLTTVMIWMVCHHVEVLDVQAMRAHGGR